MQFRHSGQQADRRRRILMEDSTISVDEFRKSLNGEEDDSPLRAYSQAATSDHQLRVTDLLPRRAWKLAAVTVSLIVVLTLLAFLDYGVHQRITDDPQSSLSMLTLDATTGLATWFASTVLLLAAVSSLLIFVLRRHRVDDYRGRYRCWFWCAVACLLASIDVTARWHLPLGEFMNRSTGLQLAGLESGWWLAILAGAGAALIIRLAFESKRCRTSILFLVVTLLAYAIAVLARVVPEADLWSRQSANLAALSGHIGLLLAIAWYGRYVCLEAQGQPTKRRRSKRKSVRGESDTQVADTPSESKRTRRRKERKTPKQEASEEAAAPPEEVNGASDSQSARKAKRTRKKKADLKVVSDPEEEAQSVSQSKRTKRTNERETETEQSTSQSHSKSKKRRKQKQQGERTPQPEREVVFEEMNEDENTQAEHENTQGLSKAERRKLRKQRRSQSRRAA